MTFFGIEICFNDLHSETANSPIIVTDDWIKICLKDVHSIKADPWIDSNDDVQIWIVQVMSIHQKHFS